jgi:hypothetical protein
MCRKAVPQRVKRDALVDLGHLRGGMAGAIELRGGRPFAAVRLGGARRGQGIEV